MEDLQRATEISASLRDLIAEEADLEGLHGNKKFDELISGNI
ncbi:MULTISPECIES: TPR end-of-group domain-containing protein [Vibrio]